MKYNKIILFNYNLSPYFIEDIFCELFVEELMFCQKLKGFELYGYKINPNHVHFLIKPNIKYNYSNIMHFLKKNFSQNINKIINYSNEHEFYRMQQCRRRHCAMSPAAEFDNVINNYRIKFIEKLGKNNNIPPFKWQKSFHDHIIRNKRDFRNHITYIQRQWLKHGLRKNKWCYVCDDIVG